MTYQELKQKRQQQINDFPMMFAFSKTQFEEGLVKLGCEASDLCSIGAGSFMRKGDKPRFDRMWNKQEADFAAAMQDDDLLRDAIKYELGNHEFCITYDPTDTLRALGITLDDERTKRIFTEAKKTYLEEWRKFDDAQRASA